MPGQEQQPEPKQLTPEMALGFIDGVAQKYMGSREDHAILMASINMLSDVVKRDAARANAPTALKKRAATVKKKRAKK